MGNRLLVFSVFLLLTANSALADTSQSEDELRDQIASQWALLKEGVVTAEIEFDSTTLFFPDKPIPPPNDSTPAPAFPQPTLSPDELLALIEECGLLSTPEERQKLIDGVHAGQKPIVEPWQTSRHLWIKGAKVRDESSSSTRVLDDANYFDISHVRGNRFSLYLRGQYNVDYTTLYEFHHIPFNTEDILKTYRITSHQSENTLILQPPANGNAESVTKVVLDATTGIPLHWRQGGTTNISRDIVQKDLIQLPNSLSLPRVTYEADYEGNKIFMLRVFVIKNVTLNGPVSDATFLLQAKSGDILLDHRVGVPRSVRLDHDILDVLAFMDGRLPGTTAINSSSQTDQAATEQRSIPAWLILLFVNGFAILVIGALMWRR
ncbi:MAG: hypothetical protein R3C18_22320 [Planctomycetaceae bacterium]